MKRTLSDQEQEQIKLLPDIQGKIITTIVDLYLNELEDIIENFEKNIRPHLKWGLGPFTSFSYKKGKGDKLLDKIMYWVRYIYSNPLQVTIDLNSKTRTGNTLLHHATKAATDFECKGFDPCNVHYLLEHGAKPNEQDNKGRTAFWYCMLALPMELSSNDVFTKKEKQKLVSHFIKHGANPNVSSCDNDFIHILASRQYSESIKQIIALADIKTYINHKDKAGNTPIHEAALHTNLEFLRMLSDNGADFNITNDEGKTPLEYGMPLKYVVNNEDVIEFLKSVTQTSNQ